MYIWYIWYIPYVPLTVWSDVPYRPLTVYQPLVPDEHRAFAHGHAMLEPVNVVAVTKLEASGAVAPPHQSIPVQVVVRLL